MTEDVHESREDDPPETALLATAESVLRRLPPRLQHFLTRLFTGWLGRVVLQSVRGFVRLEMFDRSMTIAAQVFTSVFPVLILFTTWASTTSSDRLADALSLPDETRALLADATQGAEGATFGIAGTLLVLASATSLSRALIRAFAAIWAVRKPRSTPRSAWRWLAAVLVLSLSMVVARTTTEPIHVLPPRDLLPLLVSLTIDGAVALFVPWVLLAGAVHPRLLASGALLFALLMVPARSATAVWLPRALEVSADRYGSIGVAFTYLACLYAAAFCFLATAVLGHAIARDDGWLGRWIRPHRSAADVAAGV